MAQRVRRVGPGILVAPFHRGGENAARAGRDVPLIEQLEALGDDEA